MQNLLEAEKRVRDAIRARSDLTQDDAQRIAGDVAAQVYHYLVAVAQYERAVLEASKTTRA